MKLFLIDTLSPFFAPLPKGLEYNWSKIPFAKLEGESGILPEYEEQILKALKVYIKKIKLIGYNSVTIDELCRMVTFDFYSPSLQKK